MADVRASEAQLLKTKQEDYASSMIAKLQEEGGSNILDFCEKATVTGASTYTFYRFGEGGVGTNKLDMYSGGADEKGNAGEAESYQVTIDYIYASDKIKASDVKSTSLDLKSSFVDSMVQAMKRNVDFEVLKSVDTLAGSPVFGEKEKVYIMGDSAKALDNEDIINSIIEGTVFASTLAKETSVSGRPSVAMVVTAREFAILHRAERIVNANYVNVNKVQRNTLFGCEVIKVAESVKRGWTTEGADGTTATDIGYNSGQAKVGQIILIPQGTIGAASWENDVDAKSWWDDGQDALFCRAKKSIGTIAIEPESVIRLVYKK
ncbi:MAG: phage capsid protein [Cetobacterium sp.]